MQNLTIKQKKFCDAYLRTGSALESYKIAGYKGSGDTGKSNAHNLLKMEKIQDYILKRQEKIDNKRILSIQEIQEDLTQIAKETNQKISDRLRAYELLTRMQGGFLDRSEIKASMNFEDKLKEITDDSEF